MSQRIKIKTWLESGKTLTSIDALERFGCFRLAARIADLKTEGMHIDTVMVADEDTGKSYARYSTPTFTLEFSP